MRQRVPRSVAAGEDGRAAAEPGEPGAAAGAAALGVRGRGTPPPRTPVVQRPRTFHPRPGAQAISQLAFKDGGETFWRPCSNTHQTLQLSSSVPREMIVVVSRSPGRHTREYPLRRCL